MELKLENKNECMTLCPKLECTIFSFHKILINEQCRSNFLIELFYVAICTGSFGICIQSLLYLLLKQVADINLCKHCLNNPC